METRGITRLTRPAGGTSRLSTKAAGLLQSILRGITR